MSLERNPLSKERFMRMFERAGSRLLALSALSLLAGCANSTQLMNPATTQATQDLAVKPDAATMLAVAGQKSGTILFYDSTYKVVNTIKGYLKGAIYDDHYDRSGNLYVTDEIHEVVNEYGKGNHVLTFQYTTTGGPIGVTTDAKNDVYVADYDDGINEYSQGQDTVIESCRIPYHAVGVAVDAKNRVFVTFNSVSSGTSGILEFPDGLSSCNGKLLKVSLKGPYTGQLIVDKNENLIVADQESKAVDIISPPYASISTTLPGFRGPFAVALNSAETTLYVACATYVSVVSYPKGAEIKKLTEPGIYPVGVAAYP
jgi:hypothetical protein